MVKKILLLFVMVTSILVACSQQDEEGSTEAISSFEGAFMFVNATNKLEFDCSDAAKRNISSTTLEGYHCKVDVTENTTIRTDDGKSLSVEELTKWEISKLNEPKKAKVILSEERDINKNKESREGLKASEIIILN